MNSLAVVQRQLSGGISLQGEIPALRDASAYVTERLVQDPHAITPLAHVARDFNAWLSAPKPRTVRRVGELLQGAGIPLTAAAFRGRYNVAAVAGWRVITDPGFSDLLLHLEPAPAESAAVETITAAFNATAPLGGAWTDARAAEILRGLGYTLALKRRNGVIQIFVTGHRLTGPAPLRRRRGPRLSVPKADKDVRSLIPGASLTGLTADQCLRLVKAGITTRDALADLAADELQEIAGAALPMKTAQGIIMAARAHWFAAESAGT